MMVPLMEVVIRRLPRPVPGSSHSFKYRLFYGYVGKRLIGYDNEHGKGDHRHHENEELPFKFSTPETLIDNLCNYSGRSIMLAKPTACNCSEVPHICAGRLAIYSNIYVSQPDRAEMGCS